jgi:hypothetical protein
MFTVRTPACLGASNYRLTVDCSGSSQALGLPLVPPSLARDDSSFRQGANFTVARRRVLPREGNPRRRQQAANQYQPEHAAGVVRGTGAFAVRHIPRSTGQQLNSI